MRTALHSRPMQVVIDTNGVETLKQLRGRVTAALHEARDANLRPRSIVFDASVEALFMSATLDELGEELLSDVTVWGARHAVKAFLGLPVLWQAEGPACLRDDQ